MTDIDDTHTDADAGRDATAGRSPVDPGTPREVGDVHVSWPARSTSWRAVAAVVLAFAVVIGIGSWQLVDLHDQVHHLQRTTTSAQQQIVRQERELSTLHNSVRAALSCLETPQVQPGLCAHFLR